MEAGCSGAEGVDREARMWALPPVVPFGLLMQRLEAWLRRLLRDAQSASREEVRRNNDRRMKSFLGGCGSQAHAHAHAHAREATYANRPRGCIVLYCNVL